MYLENPKRVITWDVWSVILSRVYARTAPPGPTLKVKTRCCTLQIIAMET